LTNTQITVEWKRNKENLAIDENERIKLSGYGRFDKTEPLKKEDIPKIDIEKTKVLTDE